MQRYGPDSLTSWVVAAACCFINMMMFGMARLSGVLFVASVPRFQEPRERASFPYTFSNFVRNASGPLVGYLGHTFGVRSVTTFGCFLGAVGIGACFFAEKIYVITIFWGVLFGLGFGLGNILLPVSVNQYFDKKRATASGISFSGACLGSFILPPVVELLLNEYGLSGTFLFLSGFVLNCVPAALLLKKPNFEIKPPQHTGKGERQKIVSGVNVKLYTVEGSPKKIPSDTKNSDSSSFQSFEGVEQLTYEERLRGLSTQTLVSQYCVHMSTSEPLDVEEIISNSKGRRQVDPSVLETEVISVTSQESNSGKDNVFSRDVRSSSMQYNKPIVVTKEGLSRSKAISADSINTDQHNFYSNQGYLGYQNYGYNTGSSNFEIRYEGPPAFVPKNSIAKRTASQTVYDKHAYFSSYRTDNGDLKYLPETIKTSQVPSLSKSMDSSEKENFKIRHGKLEPSPENTETSSLGVFSIIFDPMFNLIAITNAIYCFTFVCIFTIIVDFAHDLNIGEANEKYILMAVSVGDLIGRLGLGWVTDGGYMTSVGFTALLFACQGVAIAAIPFSDGFISLLVAGTLYGLTEAGLIVIFPIIIGEYIDHDKQTVAIPSSNFLSGPACLAIPPLIGYFRDHLGAYDFLFYLIAILSFACCFAWMLAPCIARWQKRK